MADEDQGIHDSSEVDLPKNATGTKPSQPSAENGNSQIDTNNSNGNDASLSAHTRVDLQSEVPLVGADHPSVPTHSDAVDDNSKATSDSSSAAGQQPMHEKRDTPHSLEADQSSSIIGTKKNDDSPHRPTLDPSEMPAVPDDHIERQSDIRKEHNSNTRNDDALPIVPTMDIYTIPPKRPDSPHDHINPQDFSPDVNHEVSNDEMKNPTSPKEKDETNKDTHAPKVPSLDLSAIPSPTKVKKVEPSASSSSLDAYTPPNKHQSSSSNNPQSAIVVNSGDKVIDVSAFQSPKSAQIINHQHDGVPVGKIPWHRKLSRWWSRFLTKHCRSCRRKTNGHRND